MAATPLTPHLTYSGGYRSIPETRGNVFDEIEEHAKAEKPKAQTLLETASHALQSLTRPRTTQAAAYTELTDEHTYTCSDDARISFREENVFDQIRKFSKKAKTKGPSLLETATHAFTSWGRPHIAPAAASTALETDKKVVRFIDERGLPLTTTSTPDSFDDVTQFLFQRNVKQATNHIVKHGKGLDDPDLFVALGQGRYIAVLKAVWSERDHEKRLAWLKASADKHSLLMCERAVSELSCFLRRAEAAATPMDFEALLRKIYNVVLPYLQVGIARLKIDHKISGAYLLVKPETVRIIYLVSIDNLLKTRVGLSAKIIGENADRMKATHYERCLILYRALRPERFSLPAAWIKPSHSGIDTGPIIERIITEKITIAEAAAADGRRFLAEMGRPLLGRS